jgi:hypothetical protein
MKLFSYSQDLEVTFCGHDGAPAVCRQQIGGSREG